MKRTLILLLGLSLMMFWSCESTEDDEEERPEAAFVGSESCGDCHESIYADFVDSGHPYKFNLVEGAAPTYPSFVENFQTLPTGATSWDQVAGVIGGFGWKSRFVGTDGHIIGTAESSISAGTGQNQYNFFGGNQWGWVDYHIPDVKKYNYGCFKCHTTGAVQTSNPDSSWMKVHLSIDAPEPMDYFEFGGVECEQCHGMGAEHAFDGNPDFIDRVTTSRLEGVKEVNALCGDCHTRYVDRSIQTSGGRIKHHEQYDEFLTTAHNDSGMKCTDCHDPHKRVIWGGDGIKTTCNSCHSSKTVNHPVTTCTSCHMPYAAKSAVARGPWVGDVASHIFSISTDTTWTLLDDTGGFVRTDNEGKAHQSLKFACYGCHLDSNGEGGYESSPGTTVARSQRSLSELAVKAVNIH